MSLYRLKGTSGPVLNQSWVLQERTVIGSGADCDIQVGSEAIAARHAVLQLGDGRINLSLLQEGGELHVNGEAIRAGDLASGDEIRIGNCRWMLQAPGLKPQKVLTDEAIRRPVRLWPWLAVGILSALALLAWRLGYISF